jgi:uncharacterized protein YndB with AHSA1/START domain
MHKYKDNLRTFREPQEILILKKNPMRTFLKFLPVLALLLMLCARQGRSEITDSTYSGFTVKVTVVVAQNPDSTFRYLVRDVSRWWDPAHTFSGNSANLIIQGKANGCFCERLENGGSVRHMTVVYVDPGKTLRMTGAMGPLQSLAVEGVMTFSLKPEERATEVTLTYEVGGYSPGGVGKWAPLVDKVLFEQMQRFRVYAESEK